MKPIPAQVALARGIPVARYAFIAALIVLLVVVPLFVNAYIIYLMSSCCDLLAGIAGAQCSYGFAGQISLGHAAFFGIGAYATALLSDKLGVPFILALPIAALLATGIGAIAGLPAIRLRSLYLAIATLGFGVVTQKILFEWRGLTGGGDGLPVMPAHIGPLALTSGVQMFYLDLVMVCLGTWTESNLTRLRTGRALIMVREAVPPARSA